MSVEVGQPAPPFELPASTGDKVSLAEYTGKGPTVLLFVPLAFTPVCTNELRIMRDDYEYYQKRNARVLATSVDSQFTLRVWADQLKLPFPLLSDFNKDTARAYGALYEDLMGLKGIAKRSAFVIDEEGIVRYRWVSEDADALPNFDEMRNTLTLDFPNFQGTMAATQFGMRLDSMTPQLREYFGAPVSEGVLVSSVEARAPAGLAGLKAGDVILSVNGKRILSPPDAFREIGAAETATLRIIRDKRSQEIRFDAPGAGRPRPGSSLQQIPNDKEL